MKDKKEKIGRMLLMHSNNREDIDEAFAGDIVACGPQGYHHGRYTVRPAKPIILERMEFPEPVIELSVEPKTKADQEKMGVALNRLAPRTRRSACRPITNSARRSSRAWASFTSTSWSTA